MSSDPISPDPFVNQKAERLVQAAYEDGVRQGQKLAAEKIRRVGRGMWDHIALLAEKDTNADAG